LQRQEPTFGDLKGQGFDPDSLWDRVDGDGDLLRDLMVLFAEQAPVMLARIEAAIHRADARELEKAGHKIKGSVLQFSAQGAAASAQQLEDLGKSGTVAGAEPLLRRLKQEIDLLAKLVNSMVCRVAD
jgi:two-component system sensor histidine kinase/response regulator